jgi:hypothetical protein
MDKGQSRHLRKPPDCPIFGVVKRMKLDVLPTIEDLVGDYQWIRLDWEHPDKQPTVSEITSVLVRKVKEIWTRASVPIVSIERITRLVQSHHDQYLKLIRYPARKRNASYEKKVAKIRENAKRTLFDISSCKCSNPDACKCPKEKKIPQEEKQSVKDQRSVWQMTIGSIDRPKTKALLFRAQRKAREAM